MKSLINLSQLRDTVLSTKRYVLSQMLQVTDTINQDLLKVAGLSTFVGSTSLANGSGGLVPSPSTDDLDKFLCADGTWKSIDSSSDMSFTYEDVMSVFVDEGGTSSINTNNTSPSYLDYLISNLYFVSSDEEVPDITDSGENIAETYDTCSNTSWVLPENAGGEALVYPQGLIIDGLYDGSVGGWMIGLGILYNLGNNLIVDSRRIGCWTIDFTINPTWQPIYLQVAIMGGEYIDSHNDIYVENDTYEGEDIRIICDNEYVYFETTSDSLITLTNSCDITTPRHCALTYDGEFVRIFVNGNMEYCKKCEFLQLEGDILLRSQKKLFSLSTKFQSI